MTRPSDLMKRATLDPASTIEMATRALSGERSPTERITLLRALGMAHRVRGEADASIAAFHDALHLAQQTGAVIEQAAIAISLAGAHFLVGEIDHALETLDGLQPAPETAGRIHFQRGTILARSGRHHEAVAEFDAAEKHLASDQPVLARLLKNRGMLHLLSHEIEAAERDLQAARELFVQLDDRLEIAMTGHDLGLVAASHGALIEALAWFNEAIPTIEEITGPHFEPGRCHALLAAGLLEEAHAEALRLADRLEDGKMETEVPEALLLAAEASLLDRRYRDAAREATRARSLFEKQHRQAWAAHARVLEMEAQEETQDLEPGELRPLIAKLDQSGLGLAGVRARIVGARVAVASGEADAAERFIRQARNAIPEPPLPIELDLLSAEFDLRRFRGDSLGAGRLAARGMRSLERQQRTIAATDVRAGLGRRAQRLASLGLSLAVESGRPRRVWTWMERSRATALRYQPIDDASDPNATSLMAELRSVTASMYRADADETLELARRQRSLEHRIANVTRAARGGAQPLFETNPTERALAQLGDGTLIEFAAVEGEMWAVIAHGDRVRLRSLGPASTWHTDARVLASALRRSLGTSDRAVEAVRRRVLQLRSALTSLLPTSTNRLVVVPTPELSAVPWPLVVDVPTTVAPSASLWAVANRAERGLDGTAAVSGPGLTHADREVDAVIAAHGGGVSGHQASVKDVLELISNSGIVHFACHGRLRRDQPLFTSLRLSDGDLNLYEFARERRLPGIVVLSSCETGDNQGAEMEMLGMASVLLGSGVRQVIASPWPVPDSEHTIDVMTSIHHCLASDRDAALALRPVAEDPTGAAFIAFGA